MDAKKKRRRLFLFLSALVFIMSIGVFLFVFQTANASDANAYQPLVYLKTSGGADGATDLVVVDAMGHAVFYQKVAGQGKQCEFTMQDGQVSALQMALGKVNFADVSKGDTNQVVYELGYSGKTLTFNEPGAPAELTAVKAALIDPASKACLPSK